MNHEILKIIRTMNEEDISALTTRTIFSRGMNYFLDGRVIGLTWSDDGSQLIGLIRGSSPTYRITITREDDYLEYTCMCPAWDDYEQCKHVVCTLLTVHHLLHNSSIPGFAGKKLKMQLLGESDESLDDQARQKPSKVVSINPSPSRTPSTSRPTLLIEGVIDAHNQRVLLYPRVVIDEEIIPLNRHQYYYLWQPFRILGDFFEGCFVDEVQQPYFKVPSDQFFNAFAELEKTLTAHEIPFNLNKKRVETIALDIAVDASQSGRGDWFELAPHMLSKGIPITDEQRDALFASGGILESEDCITVLDAQTREIIRLLAKMFTPMGQSQRITVQSVVQLPRLRVLDLLELRKSGVKVVLAAKDELLLDRLTHFSKIEKLPVPKKFHGTLREYQQSGYHWLAFLYTHHFGACLADDMGLGKTIQAIAFLGGIAEGIIENQSSIHAPHLIVLPPTLIFNWQHELQQFYPALRIKVYAGTGRNCNFDDCDIVLTTYDTVRIDIEYLKTITFHVIILDEAQAIKNIQSARAAAVRELRGVFTLSLTGTPLENHIGEYYSIIDVALPGLLPPYKQFMAMAKRGELEGLIRKMNTFVLRRTKDAILQELPPKVESNVLLEMTPKQQKIYATTVAEVRRTIDSAYNTKTGSQAHIIALTAILRLRQICISPQLIDANSSKDAPKIDYLTQTLIELADEGHAALVFSQFTSCLDLVEEALRDVDLPYYRIDGSTPMMQRKKIVESFQGGDQKVAILLLSLKTGGVGLNLTRANYVFHIDPWWNPAVENQASDRSHRIGQKNTVFVTRLVMHHTIEEKMMVLKEEKQKLFNDVMENAENKKRSLISKKDFDLLLT